MIEPIKQQKKIKAIPISFYFLNTKKMGEEPVKGRREFDPNNTYVALPNF